MSCWHKALAHEESFYPRLTQHPKTACHVRLCVTAYPTTAASSTSSCDTSAPSTSAVPTLCPLTLITSSTRPAATPCHALCLLVGQSAQLQRTETRIAARKLENLKAGHIHSSVKCQIHQSRHTRQSHVASHRALLQVLLQSDGLVTLA